MAFRESIEVIEQLQSTNSDLKKRVEELKSECERERLRLAACGTAALGYFTDCKEEYKSASLDDTLRLYKSCQEKDNRIKELEAEVAGLMEILNGLKFTFELGDYRQKIINKALSTPTGKAMLAKIEAGEKCFKVLDGIAGIIDESTGVCGWHKNGDIATWEQLDLISETRDALSACRSACEGEGK